MAGYGTPGWGSWTFEGNADAGLSRAGSSSCEDDDSAVRPMEMDLCHPYLERSLKRSFDDFEMLESGDAREYIPRELLNPPADWWECKVTREQKANFYMHLERPRSEGGNRFILSAKKVGNDFYISQYEAFPKESGANAAPASKFCAVLRKLSGAGHEFTLSPAACGQEDDTISHISHSNFKQPQCGAEVRAVAATFVDQARSDKYVWDQAAGGGAVAAGSTPGGVRMRPTHPHPSLPQPHLRRRRSSASSDSSASGSEDGDMVEVSNQLPVWDSVNGCLMMKFLRKRVRASSSKNVVLYKSDDLEQHEADGTQVDQDNAIMQFGKIDADKHLAKSTFALDFRDPIPPLQAFSMALSSFAFKNAK